MPSDQSGVTPKGTLVRAAADWFDDNLGTGGFYEQNFSPNLDNYFTVALFNNANTGVVFKVYGISAYNDGGTGWGAFWQNGAVGTLKSGCQPLRPDYPTPYGQIYEQEMLGNNPDAPFPWSLGPIAGAIGCGGFDSNTVVSPFPLFIVPVGWSLVMANLESASNCMCTFWYQVCNE